MLAPRVEATNRVQTILQENRDRNVAAKRTPIPNEVRVYSDEALLDEAAAFAKGLDFKELAEKAAYVRDRLLALGAPGGEFTSREEYFSAMHKLMVEEQGGKRKRAAPAADDDATARQALLMPDEDGEGEPESAKHRRWQVEVLQKVLTFNEQAVLDAARRVTQLPCEAEKGDADHPLALWREMYDTKGQGFNTPGVM